MSSYTCGARLQEVSELMEPTACGEPEMFRATDDVAEHAHLCREHWEALLVDEQSRYVLVFEAHGPTVIEGKA